MMCLVLLWCLLGAYTVVKWRTHMFTIFTPFFTLGPGSTTLYSTHALSHGLIASTTLYNTLQSTALQHSTVYSLQPLQHPSAPYAHTPDACDAQVLPWAHRPLAAEPRHTTNAHHSLSRYLSLHAAQWGTRQIGTERAELHARARIARTGRIEFVANCRSMKHLQLTEQHELGSSTPDDLPIFVSLKRSMSSRALGRSPGFGAPIRETSLWIFNGVFT